MALLVTKCQHFVKPVLKTFKNPYLTRQFLPNNLLSSLRNCYSYTMSKTACVFLANGAEEMEFVITVDVLRRAGIEVTVAGVPECQPMRCSRDVNILPEIGVDEVKSKGPFDVYVLPGGLGGAKAFATSEIVGELLKEQEKSGGLIAAICAAPTALKTHSIGVGKSVTSYPAMKGEMLAGDNYKYLEEKVVVDGNLITSRGPGTAFDFALTIVDKLLGKEAAEKTAAPMLLSY